MVVPKFAEMSLSKVKPLYFVAGIVLTLLNFSGHYHGCIDDALISKYVFFLTISNRELPVTMKVDKS